MPSEADKKYGDMLKQVQLMHSVGESDENINKYIHDEVGNKFIYDPDFSLTEMYARIIVVQDKNIDLDSHDKYMLKMFENKSANSYYSYETKILQRIMEHKEFANEQIKHYKKVANTFSILYNSSQSIIIAGAAIVTLLLTIQGTPKVIPAIISGIVTFAASLEQRYKFNIHAKKALSTAEGLRRQLQLYSSQIGKYRMLGPSKALEYFMEQTETLIHQYNQEKNVPENSNAEQAQ